MSDMATKKWPIMPLRDIALKITKGTTPTSLGMGFQDAGINFIKAESVTRSGMIDESTFAYISEKTNEKLKRSQIETDDVLVTIAGIYLAKIGLVKSSHVPANTNQAVAIVRPDKRVVAPEYLKAYLSTSHVNAYLNSLCPQAAQPNLNLTQLGKFSFPLPPLPLQRKIAAILTAYDDLIENNRQRIVLLEKMAEEIYREWFVRLRFPGHEHTPVHKGVPEGWRQLPSSELLEVMSGGTPKTDKSEYWDGDIPFFTPGDATANFYCRTTEKNITDKGLESCNSPLYPARTIFVTARGTVGKIALSAIDMAMNQSCYALTPKSGSNSIYYFLALRGAVAVIRSISKSGVFSNIVIDTFRQIPLFEPPSELLDNFDRIVAPIFDQIEVLQEANIKLVETRDLLLNRLISGKLRVDDLDIQFPPSMQDTA